MDQDLSMPEIQFKKVMGIMAALFLIAALFFIFIPEQMIQTANFVGKLFKLPKAPIPEKLFNETIGPILNEGAMKTVERPPLVMGRGYVALAISLMSICIAVAFACWLNPRKYMDYVPLLLLAKLTSSAFGLIFYLTSARYFGNLGITIIDFPVFLVIGFFWMRARGARGPVATVKAV